MSEIYAALDSDLATRQIYTAKPILGCQCHIAREGNATVTANLADSLFGDRFFCWRDFTDIDIDVSSSLKSSEVKLALDCVFICESRYRGECETGN